MLRIASLLFALAGFSTFAACGDDPVKPGALDVKWSTGPTAATCGSFSVKTIQVRAMKGEEEIASASSNCDTDATGGTISIPEIAPGTYSIEVEALNADGKGTYFGKLAKQTVSQGKTAQTSTIVIALKPALITVDWTLPGGGRCSTAGIVDVEVYLYYNASTAPSLQGAARKVKCDSTGMEFPDLVPNTDVKIIGYGYDAAKKQIAKGSTEFFPLGAGDDLDKVIPLAACPGTPPVCD